MDKFVTIVKEWKIVIIVAIVLATIGSLLYWGNFLRFDPIQDAIMPESVVATKYCKRELLATMKSPSSTKFISINVEKNIDINTVHIVYDSQNSFGVMLRGEKNCYVGFIDGSNKPLIMNHSEIEIDDIIDRLK